jgi:hypothetical protein
LLNSLLFVTVLSLLLLFFSFLLVYAKVERKSLGRFVSFMVVFICMAFPVLYTVYGELNYPSYSASIGLGMAFLFTWALTAVIFIFSILFRYKRQDEDEFYLL